MNREVTATAGREGAVHLSEQADNGIAWIEGSDFGDGAIEIEEFESPVKASVAPTGWAPLRLVVKGKTLQIYVGIYIGAVSAPTLEVRKLGSHDRGQVGLWGGNGSDGDFENLRIVPAK